jgi:hypothetical protein
MLAQFLAAAFRLLCLPFLRDLLVGIGIDDSTKTPGVTNPTNTDASKSHHQEYRRGNHRSQHAAHVSPQAVDPRLLQLLIRLSGAGI